MNLIFIFLALFFIFLLIFSFKRFKDNNANKFLYYFIFIVLGILIFWTIFLLIFTNGRVLIYHAEYLDAGLISACFVSAVSAVVVIIVFLINYHR